MGIAAAPLCRNDELVKSLLFTLLCGLILLVSACGTFEVGLDQAQTPDVAATGTVGALQSEINGLRTEVAALKSPSVDSTPMPPLSSATALPPTAQVASSERITFLNGATVGAVNSSIVAGGQQVYVLQALKGQPMFAYVGSPNNDVILSISRQNGAPILSASEQRTSWQGSLPATEDYYLTIHGGTTAANYSLTVTLPSRIQFSQGADSMDIDGQTVAGYDVSYVIYASKGQTMSVDLGNLSGQVALSIYGFTDGQPYVRSASELSSFSFVLPSSQDYIVVVVPSGNNVVSYTMTVQVR